MAWFQSYVASLRGRMSLLLLAVALIPLLGLAVYVSDRIYWLEVKNAAGGLMNFADAKQQGVIRFLGANEKLAKQLATLVETAEPDAARGYFASIVATDVFRSQDHPFRSEIETGKRHISTWKTYRWIDYVKSGKIVFSSDPSRAGRAWTLAVGLKNGYSDVYRLDGQPVVTFCAPAKSGMVYVHSYALILTNIVNGEIGN